jgi:glycogen synthase
MKIAFISYVYLPEVVIGGIGSYTQHIASLLARGNFEVHIFAGSFIQSKKTSQNGITFHWVYCTDPDDFKDNVVAYFEKENLNHPFQLIESAEIHANAIEIKKRFPAIPLIVRLHASNYLVESLKKKYMPLKIKWRYFLGALRRGKWDLGYWRKYDFKNDRDYLFTLMADHITAPSQYMKDWVIQHWKMNPDNIVVLSNPFVEKSAFKGAITNNEEPVIIYFGRLSVLKGLITATRAMKHILINNPGWKWMVVGDDDNAANGKSSMKEWMKGQLKMVTDQVVFYDSLPNDQIPFLLEQASIVLIPSLFESYSYVTIEAMCAGKAIVGSKGTAIEALIENNVTGKIADPYRPGEWQLAIQQLMDDVDLRKQLGKAAAGHVANEQIINGEIVNYYKGLIKAIPVKC